MADTQATPAPDAAPAEAPVKGRKGKAAPDSKAEAAQGEGKPSEAKAPAAKSPRKPAKAAEAAQAEGPRKKERGRSARKPSKRFRKLLEMQPQKPLPVREAVSVLRKMGGGLKFNQTVNIVMFLGIDSKQADQAIRGAVSLPKGIGKPRKVICFAEGEDAEKAKAAGAMEVGADDLIAKINGGWQDFDVAIAHPRLMGKVGKLGRVLGPSGKMPSPKNGTVSPDVATAVKEFAAGKVEYRNDAAGNVHAIVGKMNFPEGDLVENVEAFIDHIRRAKPATSKGQFIRKVCISGTMTPSVEIAAAV